MAENGSETPENDPILAHLTFPGPPVSLAISWYQLSGAPRKCIKINAKIVVRYKILDIVLWNTYRYIFEELKNLWNKMKQSA